MAQVIRTVERGGFKVMLLTVTNIQSEEYFYNCLGYDMTCSVAQPSSVREIRAALGW